MVGKIYNEAGLLENKKEFKLVKKVGKKGDIIQKHNHPEALVLFTVVKGKMEVHLNEEETYIVEVGSLLHFDGNNYIDAKFLEDSEIFVTLITK